MVIFSIYSHYKLFFKRSCIKVDDKRLGSIATLHSFIEHSYTFKCISFLFKFILYTIKSVIIAA